MKTAFKNDKYKNARGGYSRLLEIRCQKCNKIICHYQKDGPGSLKRMYIDRITGEHVSISGSNLNCPEAHLLGIKMTYEKENRLAFRLFLDSVTKKIIKRS